MRKSKFTDSQIVATLKQVEGGRKVKGDDDACDVANSQLRLDAQTDDELACVLGR
jgi:hypothetical protein